MYPTYSGMDPLTLAPAVPRSLFSGIVSHWKLDETSGTRADSIGGHTLTDENTVPYSVSGKVGNCADLDSGDSDYLERANASAGYLLGVTGDWTFATWVKPESRTSGARVVTVWPGMGTSNRAWMIDLQADGADRFFSFGVGGDITRATDTVAANCANATWAHVLVQHNDGVDIRIKVNNQAWIVTSYTDGIDAVNTDFRLGGRGTMYNGLMDETSFWKRSLTERECGALYNDGYGIALFK